MDKHLISLAFNKRVNNYEDKIAYIAERIQRRFGDRVDASLPMSRNPNVVKHVYINTQNFGEASKLADEVAAFLREPEMTRELNTANIEVSARMPDLQYARGWSNPNGRFAQRMTFNGF